MYWVHVHVLLVCNDLSFLAVKIIDTLQRPNLKLQFVSTITNIDTGIDLLKQL